MLTFRTELSAAAMADALEWLTGHRGHVLFIEDELGCMFVGFGCTCQVLWRGLEKCDTFKEA